MLQAARHHGGLTDQHRAVFEARRRRRPFALICAAVAILVVVNIALWISFGRSVASGGYGARARIALLLVPAIMLVALVLFLRRRMLAAEAMAELPAGFSNGGRLPQVTRVVLRAPPRPGTSLPLGQQRQLALANALARPVVVMPPARGAAVSGGARAPGEGNPGMVPIRIV